MIVEDQPPWAPNLRSRARLRSAVKRHFVDPSLAVAALGAQPEQLLSDLNLLGFLFESLVVRDLRVYSQGLGAHVLQYRDGTGLEIDVVIERADGRWAAFEVKLGPGLVDAGAAALLKLAAKVDTDAVGPPIALGVIVGSGYGLQRPDGVMVVPIGALGP
jgi:predicted AAA+ superfamily ATPase